MKTLICYATKKGTTLKCSRLIADKTEDYILIDIKDTKGIVLEDYERIYIGTPVYFGRINKRIAKFIESNKNTLSKTDLRIFTVGMDDKNIKETRKRNFPQEILDSAIIKYVGGAYNFENMNFLERFIVRKIGSIDESLENIKRDKINELITDDKN